MKLTNVKSFKLALEIKGFFLCSEKYLKTTRFGDAFIDLILKDATGSIRGKIWSQVEYFSSKFEKGDIVAVKGNIIKFNNENEISLKFINKASEEFYNEYGYNPSLIIGKINTSVKPLDRYILKQINSLSTPHRKIILSIYKENKKKIQTMPIEKNGYYLNGGYLLFIYNLLNNCNNLLKEHKNLDKESILICILLAHIGYIKYFNDDQIFSISEKGNLLGHKVLGINILINNMSKIKSNNEEDKIFYEQCIMMDDSTEDKSIKFVRSVIDLDTIVRE